MSSRISKIKIVDYRLNIHQIVETPKSETEIVTKSSEPLHADFEAAFRALEQHAREILEWPASYAQGRVKITGVSYSYSESTDVEGAVITGQVQLETSDAPFSFNTPHLAFDQYSETGKAKLMPEEAQEALEQLRREAREFLKGKGRQADLFPAGDGKSVASEQGSAT